MKKVIIILISLLGLVTLTGCKEQSISFVYDVTARGDAKGDVELTFVNGQFTGIGDVDLDFVWSNDTTNAVNGEYALLLHNALHSPDKEIADAALRTKNWLDENFSVAGGDYYVIIDAKVKESLTGIEFRWKKEFTNRK